MEHKDSICIVSCGCVTAVGNNAPATAAAVRAGIAGFQEHPYMVNQEGDPYVLATSPFIDASVHGVNRYLLLAKAAIEEALLPISELETPNNIEIDVTIGLPEIRPGVTTEIAGELSSSVKEIETKNCTINEVRTAYKGHAAGLMALNSAIQLLASGACEFCLLGGVDSYIDPDTLDWIEDNEQLHIPSNAWGFIPGEAAAFCLLCSEETARRYRLPSKAKLTSVATAQEPNCIKTETVCIGEGLTAAVNMVLQDLPEKVKINQTYCDQNGEAYRADEFGFMLARLSNYFLDPSDYVAPADCWGDVGAASGPLFIVLLCFASEKDYANGATSLLWASSESGDRSAALMKTEIG